MYHFEFFGLKSDCLYYQNWTTWQKCFTYYKQKRYFGSEFALLIYNYSKTTQLNKGTQK